MSCILAASGAQCSPASAVKQDYVDLQNASSAKAVGKKLASLQEAGKTLQKEAVRAKYIIEEEERELEQRLKELTVKKMEFENEVKRLTSNKASAEARCCTLNIKLSDKRRGYWEARKNLSVAQDRLQEVREEAEFASTIGLVVGSLLFGLLGGYIGRGIASLINESESKIKCAENILSVWEGDVQKVIRELRNNEISISRMQQRIDDIQSDMKRCNDEIKLAHDKMTTTKKLISLHLRAAHLWEQFETAAENTTGCTERLKDSVTKATDPKRMSILKSNGFNIKVTSFMNAWQVISKQGQILGIYSIN